jgi:LmbE family N-acetylglucosaminyl deacetylase
MDDASDIYIPDGVCLEEAQARTSHLGIGAHQDDLEFMAFHGIASCYRQPAAWFSGITVTDGRGSAREGAFADVSDEEMAAIRAEEQRKAARIGEYSCLAQLGYRSADIRAGEGQRSLIARLEDWLLRTQPEIVYTHNPADRHRSHVAVCRAVLAALQHLPPSSRPKKVYGCEVWRDLDWLEPEDRVALDVSAYPELAEQLNACFASQIEGGKDYGRAVIGRRRAHASFAQSHQVDGVDQLWFAMDLTSLIEAESAPPSLEAFVRERIDRFAEAVRRQLTA